MKWIKVAALWLCINACFTAQSQNVRDSCYAIPLTGLHFSLQAPMGDLAKRFGITGSAGIPVWYKTHKNWIFGVEGSYFFGRRLKESVMTNLETSDGSITANDGAPGRLRINERGLNFYASVGKILPFWNHNKNCGPMVTIGAGWMQHKVNIYDLGKNIPQLKGDLKKGYDRLTGGPALTQFIGYLYLSDNRLANFYAGFEFNEGFTKGLRGYQYDLKAPDSAKRFDMQAGFRVGWILPLYNRVKEYYIY